MYLKHIFNIEDQIFSKEIKRLIPIIEKQHSCIIDFIRELPCAYKNNRYAQIYKKNIL